MNPHDRHHLTIPPATLFKVAAFLIGVLIAAVLAWEAGVILVELVVSTVMP